METSPPCSTWLLAGGYSHAKAQSRVWNQCWLLSGGFTGTIDWGAYTGPLNVASWLPHSPGAASQEWAFQKGQVEAVLPITIWLQGLYCVSSALITGPPGLERKGHILRFLMEECQCHILRKVCSRGRTDVAILRKYTLLQGTSPVFGRWSQEGTARHGEVRSEGRKPLKGIWVSGLHCSSVPNQNLIKTVEHTGIASLKGRRVGCLSTNSCPSLIRGCSCGY